MPRTSADVVGELLDAMRETVTDYTDLRRTNDTFHTIIGGTAVFPGGSGVWRGEVPFGELPEWFPERPIMFVAHNFDKEKSYRDSLRRGIESMNDGFWRTVRAYIRRADLREEHCFFTNALMGLQPLKATGKMNATQLFREQCRAFMLQQIDIVKPGCIAILGEDAAQEMRYVDISVPSARLLHPSALRYKKQHLRARIIAEQSVRLKCLWASSHN